MMLASAEVEEFDFAEVRLKPRLIRGPLLSVLFSL
ncbi:hypothetical protein T266_27605 [Pseudomonas aeruginosa VRFPA05]|nr:hypothetical protein T266_27605 [Pseudomonas aeruginosa VRFPA05]